MLMDQTMKMMQSFVKEIKETDPEKRDHFVKISTLMFEISKELFAVSPEFRRGFAEVHSEFLKYPESADVIRLGLEAYELQKQKNKN